MKELKSIAELAKENMLERFMGGSKIKESSNRNYQLKETTCIVCYRPMTVKKWEKKPHYCYKCEPELEAVFQDN